MGTFEPSNLENASSHSLLQSTFPICQGCMCCPRLGDQHVLQIPAAQAGPCCRVSCPLPSPPPPHWEKMLLGKFRAQNQLPGTL